MIAAAVYLCRHYRKEMAALAERQKENVKKMSMAVARGSAAVQREAQSVRRRTVSAMADLIFESASSPQVAR